MVVQAVLHLSDWVVPVAVPEAFQAFLAMPLPLKVVAVVVCPVLAAAVALVPNSV